MTVIINSLTVDSECICNMGWMKIAVISAVGVYSFRSVTRVNQLVKQVNVPRHSLLDKYSPKVFKLCVYTTFSKIKSVYISSSCCCCHLSLFLSTWISSFPRLQAWQPQARQPWPTENRFPPKSSPPSPHYLRSEESCAIIWLPSLSPSNPQYVFLSLAPGVNCWLWVYS